MGAGIGCSQAVSAINDPLPAKVGILSLPLRTVSVVKLGQVPGSLSVLSGLPTSLPAYQPTCLPFCTKFEWHMCSVGLESCGCRVRTV